MKPNIVGIPIYQTAKPVLERLFDEWTLMDQFFEGRHESFVIKTEFCQLECSTNGEDDEEVRFSSLARDPNVRRQSTGVMQNIMGDYRRSQSQNDQLLWLEKHETLFRAWCQPFRCLKLEKAYEKISNHRNEGSFLYLNSYPEPNLQKRNGQLIFKLPPSATESAKKLATRASPFITQIFQSFPLEIEVHSSNKTTSATFCDRTHAIRISADEGRENVAFTPMAILSQNRWLHIGQIMRSSIWLVQGRTLEDQLYLILKHIYYFRTVCETEGFDASLAYFNKMEELQNQYRRVATCLD